MDFSRLTVRLVLLLLMVQLSTQACTKAKIKNGRVRLRRRGKMAIYRCRSSFTIYGSNAAVCISGQWSNPPPKCIASGCPGVTASEGLLIEPTHDSARMAFTCVTAFKLKGPAEIFCDKVSWDKPPPVCLLMSSMLSCDFEQPDLCGWKQSSNDDFDWLRHTGQTPSGDTGPSADHTFGQSNKGNYMFIETSSPRKAGDAAQLWSPLYLPDQSDQCFELYYHMMGKDDDNAVGSLDIFVKPESKSLGSVTASFHEEGNQGDKWKRAEIQVPTLEEKFQVIVMATRLESYASDIAIDDVRLYNCSEVTTVDPLKTSTAPIMSSSTTATLSATTATITIKRHPTTSPPPTLTTARPTRPSTTTVRTTTQARTTRRRTTQAATTYKSPTHIPRTTNTTPTTTPTTTKMTVASTRKSRRTIPPTPSSTSPSTIRPRRTTTTSTSTMERTKEMIVSTTTRKPRWTRRPRWTRQPRTKKPTMEPVLSTKTSLESDNVTETSTTSYTMKSTEKQLYNATMTKNNVHQTSTENSVYNSSSGYTNSSDIFYQTNGSPPDKKSTTSRTTAFLPLAIGIGGGVVFVIIVIAILATVWAKKKKRHAVEPYEELEPITKAVSNTSLNLNLVNDYNITGDE